jgi:hypothetical protein
LYRNRGTLDRHGDEEERKVRQYLGFAARTLSASVVALAMIFSVAGGAEARINPGSEATRTRTVTVSAAAIYGGRTVKCPRGDRIVNGGAYWHRHGQNGEPGLISWIGSSSPTPDGRGWYATGVNKTGLGQSPEALDFTVVAHCLPASTLGAYTVRTREVIVDPDRSGNADLKCPSGELAVTGGATWHRPGHAPETKVDGYVTSSVPDVTRHSGWSVAGWNPGPGVLRLTVMVLCLPVSVLGSGYDVHFSIQPANTSASVEGYLACPLGERVVAGGSYWAYADGDIFTETTAVVISSSATADGTAWYAAGSANDSRVPLMRFFMEALCLPV